MMRTSALLLLLAAAPASLTAQQLDFDEVPVGHIRLTLPGNAVVRGQERWETLWHRFGPVRYDGEEAVRGAPPRVDFTRHMVVVAALGAWPSGCSDSARIVRRVVERADSIVVTVGQHVSDGGGWGTCAAVVYPRQFIRIPRRGKPVAFHGAPERVPARAVWWDVPTVAEIARMERREREAFPGLLLADPRTPLRRVVELIDHGAHVELATAALLLQRPDVLASPAASARVVVAAGPDARALRARVFDLHGVALARDRRTRADVLAMLVEEFRHRQTRPVPIALALVRHPGMLADRALLDRFLREAQSIPEVRDEGCRAYAARYPVWEPLRHEDGSFTGQWTARLSFCPALPPRPASP